MKWMIGILVTSIFCIITGGMIYASMEGYEKMQRCSKACGFKKYQIIDGRCYCQNETGFEVPK